MSSITTSSIPSSHRALVFNGANQTITVNTMPMPTIEHGSVIVRILSTNVEPGFGAILSGKSKSHGLSSPEAFTIGSRAIGRVVAIGPDTTMLQPGQLVLCDPFVRGRDNPDVQFLWGFGVFGSDPRALKLMEDSWMHGMYAEYTRAPLENTYALNEKLLLGDPADGGLGYELSDLTVLARYLVVYGGLRGINLQAGETIIIAPATGGFSGAAVEVASAMGANVIAVGRNLKVLQKVAARTPRVNIVQLKGDVQEDLASLQKFGPIDAFLDISPGVANESTHVRSCMMAVRQYGRVSLMGVIQKDIAIPYVVAVLRNLTIRGQYMYEREDVRGLIRLVESGLLKLGKKAGHEIVGRFGLDEWEKAFKTVAENAEAGQLTLFEFNKAAL